MKNRGINRSLHALLGQALFQRLWNVRGTFFHRCALYYAFCAGPEVFL